MSPTLPAHQVHRQKSSQDEDQNIIVVSPPADEDSTSPISPTNGFAKRSSIPFSMVGPPPAPKNRAYMAPARGGHSRSASFAGGLGPTSSASPLRSTFVLPQSNGINGHHPSLPSPYRSASSSNQPPSAHGGHFRTRSISAYSPTLPSPLSIPTGPNGLPYSPLPTSPLPSSTTLPNMNGFPPPPPMFSSRSAPEALAPVNGNGSLPPSPLPPLSPINGTSAATAAAQHKRRHSRMHSRNLSVFFPRPGSLPHSAISEDAGQELEVPADIEAPVVTMPSAGSSVSIPGSRRGNRASGRAAPPLTPLGAGFKFGGRSPSSSEDLTAPPYKHEDEADGFSRPARRGHHHKHSMSHNFFSFLEPGSAPFTSASVAAEELHTQPTPIPVSPWAPISAFPDSAQTTSAASAFPPAQIVSGAPKRSGEVEEAQGVPLGAAIVALAQFVLGAWLWVCGQQIGSLSCTGLGYWVVFDAFGVTVAKVMPLWLASPSSSRQENERTKIRRPYGNGRLETVLMFSQAVYLMFSSVYVCKETVEHLLLSAGGGEGHHHHAGDEQVSVGIDFPIIMIFCTFISLFATAFFYENNSNLVNLSGNRIPPLNTIIRSFSSRHLSHYIEPPPTDPIAVVLSNPFVACPLFFCVAIFSAAAVLSPSQHRIADLVLASIIAGLTFKVAYRASVVLGAVLLQTSPPRAMPSGKIEAFLRAMREVERHPHVMHLPAPHIWQLAPSLSSQAAPSSLPGKKQQPSDQLVVTLEIHVHRDLSDDDVLALTKWAWERCVSALGGYKEFKEVGEVGGPEITVGVVRG